MFIVAQKARISSAGALLVRSLSSGPSRRIVAIDASGSEMQRRAPKYGDSWLEVMAQESPHKNLKRRARERLKRLGMPAFGGEFSFLSSFVLNLCWANLVLICFVADRLLIPTVSSEPEVFEAQQRIFGYREPNSGLKAERKAARRARIHNAKMLWQEPTIEHFKQSVRYDLKKRRYKLRQAGAPQEEIDEVQEVLNIFQYTEEQRRRKQKLISLKRRGKGPPKKGQGKRAKK